MLWMWIDYWLFLYWLLFIGFCTSFTNLLILIVLGEVFWIIMYSYIVFLSSIMDLFFLFILSIYLLILATTESSIGIGLLVLRFNIIGTIFNEIFFFKNYFFLRKKISLNIFSKLI